MKLWAGFGLRWRSLLSLQFHVFKYAYQSIELTAQASYAIRCRPNILREAVDCRGYVERKAYNG